MKISIHDIVSCPILGISQAGWVFAKIMFCWYRVGLSVCMSVFLVYMSAFYLAFTCLSDFTMSSSVVLLPYLLKK